MQKETQNTKDEKENEIEDLNGEIETLNDDIEDLNREKKLLEEKFKFLCAYGINFFGKDSDFYDSVIFILNRRFEDNFTMSLFPEHDIKDFYEFDEMIDYWQSHLNTKKYNYLNYDKKILESLYFGLQTDQLILLMGNPGTGKTSLVRALAKSFNFVDAATIPVQSNWTDKNDLLGYYNPLEKSYVSTPFLDALINFSRQAVQNPEKLFIICLDEMNLSHVEYYFAEFLSVLQDDNAEITLYSEQLRKDILFELENSGFKAEGDKIFYEGTPLEKLSLLERKYYFELRRLAQMLINYPAKFKIPKNVKFFGTLNQDETTLDISPKVLDRSYVIRVEKFFDEGISVGEETPLKYKPLVQFMKKFDREEDDDDYNFEIDNITDFLEIEIHHFKAVNVSQRVISAFLNLCDCSRVFGADKMKDFIIASCVLPKVRLDEENYKIYADEIKKLCTDELSQKILNQIDNGKDIDFWRR